MIFPDELSAPPRPRFSRWMRRAVAVAGLGLLVAVVCGGRIAMHAVPAITASTSAQELITPVDATMTLAGSEYAVYQLTAEDSVVDAEPLGQIGPDDVFVSVNGDGLDVSPPGRVTQTLKRDGEVYTAVAFFTAPHPGEYKVVVDAPEGMRVVVTRSIASAFTGMLPWFAGTVIGIVVLLVGLVLLAVAALRGDRRPLNTLPPPVGPAPPGWYADPLRPGRARWWDGDTWTERVR